MTKTKVSGGPHPAEVRHPFFPGYTLKLVPNDDLVGFRCDGCEQPGAGARYESAGERGLDLNLHISCALADTVSVKKIGGNEFVFRQKPTGPADETTYCDACGRDAAGFIYHCSKLDNDLHPCCADLAETFNLGVMSFKLLLDRSSPGEASKTPTMTKTTEIELSGAVPAHRGQYPSELRNPFFPGYTLKLVPDDNGVEFRCDGCKMPGAGKRYTYCERGLLVDDVLNLHIWCALAHTVSVKKIGGNDFVFRQKPTGPADETTYCDACGRDAVGFVYHCFDSKHEYDLHPCCAYLPESFNLAGISFELHTGAPPRRCRVCDKKKLGPRQRKCWTYGSVGGTGDDDETVFLHVPCARDFGSEYAREEVIPVRAQLAMNRLLLRRRGPIRRRHVSAIRVIGVIVRAVIGVIFGDPTAMIVAFAGAFSTGG